METIIKAVDEFVSRMKEQGYDSAFLAGAGYPGQLKECLLNYIGQAALGDEKAIKDGLSISTYLRWEGAGHDYIHARMSVRLTGNKFRVAKMSLALGNAHGKTRELDLNLNGKQVPTRAEAIAAIDSQKHRPMKKKSYRL
ncbi:hypothetical protein [Sphingobacterium siyangense]|uniref:hypothetical protein n=1 Tax=Sphingobacterium siyangense TaxID=459529 RepID=UPI001965AA0B|nr:hypothetical protein [Sphingobacterium siyangense]QRY55581.1 hypothetical protein JVX97_16205 [Sphingobacterium siyangense]